MAPLRILANGAVVAILLASTTVDASADDDTDVNLHDARVESVVPGGNAESAGATGGHEPVIEYEPVCALTDERVCGQVTVCSTADGQPGVFYFRFVDGQPDGWRCLGPAEAREEGVVTPDLVLRAMRRLDWPASPLVIQPPDGLTLVNFETNFYTTGTAPITRRVTLLGQRITIEATPSEFTWSFGDGESLATSDPGAAYPDLRVTHNYLRKGTYRPSLATTYTGRFRVGNGAWRQIPGTVTIDGSPQPLRAIEATPKLVGY